MVGPGVVGMQREEADLPRNSGFTVNVYGTPVCQPVA